MDTATIDGISQMVSTLGFPIFVSAWLLIKGSQERQETNDALNRLTTAITILTELVKGGSTKGE